MNLREKPQNRKIFGNLTTDSLLYKNAINRSCHYIQFTRLLHGDEQAVYTGIIKGHHH